MPGKLGSGGPPPKRESQRRRQNKPDVPIDRGQGAEVVEIPDADLAWHPVARRWFDSLALSGQSEWYEPSDWATAYVVAESMSREFHPQPIVVGSGKDATVEMHNRPPTGAALSAWLKAMTSLMVLEGDRRRLRLELVREQGGTADPEVAKVAELHSLSGRLTG